MKFYSWLILTLAFGLGGQAYAGGSGAHGGKGYAAEFTALARAVTQQLIQARITNVDDVDIYELESTINATQVKTTKKALYLNGDEKDALNYYDKKLIVLSLKGYPKLDLDIKRRLSIHEFLGVLHSSNHKIIDDDKFEVSSKILQTLGRSFTFVDSLNKRVNELSFQAKLNIDRFEKIREFGIACVDIGFLMGMGHDLYGSWGQTPELEKPYDDLVQSILRHIDNLQTYCHPGEKPIIVDGKPLNPDWVRPQDDAQLKNELASVYQTTERLKEMTKEKLK